jgi:DNA-binding MarR family transcriptional regulator
MSSGTRYELLVAKTRRYPDLDPVACEAYLTVRQVGDALKAAQEQRLAAEGISLGRFMVLAVLDRTPDHPLPASELAEAAGVTKQTVTSLLDGLARDGFVTRQPCSEDRRCVLVRLEEKGRLLLERILPGMYRRQVEIMGDLTSGEQQELARLLRKVRPDPTPINATVNATGECE